MTIVPDAPDSRNSRTPAWRARRARWLLGCAAALIPACGPGPGPAAPVYEAREDAGKEVVAPVAGPHFVNVADAAGLDRVLLCGGTDKDHLLESTGTGAAWLDYDDDGRLDALLVNAWALDEAPSGVREKGKHALYHNNGDGTFTDVTERAGIDDDSWGSGIACADYDNDGREDIYITCFGPNRLYRNNGDGTFEQVAERAGVADPGWSCGAAFFDADADGDLDLYVANYIEATIDEVLAARRTSTWREKVKVMAGPFGLRGGRDHFYRNNGDGTFQDATDAVGMTDTSESYGLGVLASDLDNDGDIDVYVANDSNPNFLYRNNGDGTFTEIGAWSGAGLSGEGSAQAGMGVDAGDFDGDGLEDILVTNFAQDTATLYHNEGGLLFTDHSAALKLKAMTYTTLKWGCGFFDYDSDADLDIVIVNGHIYPQVETEPSLGETYKQRPILLRNDAGKALVDVSRQAGPGFQEAHSARGLAIGDADGDGDPDLLVTTMDSPPLLLRNDSKHPGHWVKVRPRNRHGSPAIGARVIIAGGGKRQVRELRSGSSYQSQNAPELLFGLGASTRVERVEVRWPDGGRTVLQDQHANAVIELRQPPKP